MVGNVYNRITGGSRLVNEQCWSHERNDAHSDMAVKRDPFAEEDGGGLLFHHGQDIGHWWNQDQQDKGNQEKKGPEVEVQENLFTDIDRVFLDSTAPFIKNKMVGIRMNILM